MYLTETKSEEVVVMLDQVTMNMKRTMSDERCCAPIKNLCSGLDFVILIVMFIGG
jgi:hypothetical protein